MSNQKKLQHLADMEGFISVQDMITASMLDRFNTGICTNDGCDNVAYADPEGNSHCDECGTDTIQSVAKLLGIM